MNMNETKILVESRGMVYKGEFLKQLSEEEFSKGVRKVNLQNITRLDSPNGEGCWAWIDEEDRKKYDNDNDGDLIKVILANSPIGYNGVLFWGSELLVKCNGRNRPTLSKEWVTEKILNADWFENNL